MRAIRRSAAPVGLIPIADGLVVSFQRVPERKTLKNRLHLDVEVEDVDEAQAKIEALGVDAWRSTTSPSTGSGGDRWPIPRATGSA
jgi:hypothetical protein